LTRWRNGRGLSAEKKRAANPPLERCAAEQSEGARSTKLSGLVETRWSSSLRTRVPFLYTKIHPRFTRISIARPLRA
jgi:hypothetical protein